MSRSSIPPIPPNPLLRKQAPIINHAFEELSELSSISGADGIVLQRGPTGSVLENRIQQTRDIWFYGVVVSTSYGGNADYTDSRYLVQSVSIAQVALAIATDTANFYCDGNYWVTATNTVEAMRGTHNLQPIAALSPGDSVPSTGTIVRVQLINAAKATSTFDDLANAIYVLESVAANTAGFFPVIIKGNGGTTGTKTTACTFAYDLYALTDTTYVTKFNLAGAIQPKCSRARILNAPVTAATDGTVASAYYDTTGAIQLFDCQEFVGQNNCS